MTAGPQLPREPDAAGHFRDIHSLTALRGVAALLVVVYHFSGSFLPALDLTYHSGIISKFYLWVDFFFLLSGFILVHVYGDRFSAAKTWPTVREFIFARLARIYPLHLAVPMGFLALELVKLVLFHAGLVEDEPYSEYLLHMLVLDVANTASRALVGQRFGRTIETAEASMLALGACIVVVLAVSQLLYRWVERPARDALKRSCFAKRNIYA